jgi:hypothetical protein
MLGYCEHDSNLPAVMIGGKYLTQLSNCQRLNGNFDIWKYSFG